MTSKAGLTGSSIYYNNVSLFIFFSCITFALYGWSINNFLVLDDFVRMKAASEGSLSENFHFFPLPLLVYRAVYLLFGLSPLPLRVVNYLFNAAACVLVFKLSMALLARFVKQAGESRKLAVSFFAALLFCIHYIHVETVVYYSELHEMLYSVFYLSGLVFYLKYRQDGEGRYLIFIFISYLCCILSKETAVTFTACVFLSEILAFKSGVKDFFRKYYPLLVITAAFGAVRYFFFSSLDVLNRPQSVLSVISETLKNYVFSFTAFVVSLDFTLIKDIYKSANANFTTAFYDLVNIYPLSIAGIMFAGAVYLLIFKKPHRLKYILAGFCIITISSFAWLAGYERYLYLPSAGFCILLSWQLLTAEKLYAFNKKPLYIILALAAAYHIYSLAEKQSQWITASSVSEKTVARITELTKGLPAGSKVYFKNLPGEYKSAWVLRYGIHEVPALFLKRNDLEFYYIYQKPGAVNGRGDVYVYDYAVDVIYKE